MPYADIELYHGRYVVKKDESIERDIACLKDLAQKVPEPLSSLLLSMTDISDDFFFWSWSKAVDTLVNLTK